MWNQKSRVKESQAGSTSQRKGTKSALSVIVQPQDRHAPPQKQAQEVPNDVQETPNGDQKRANGKVRKAEKSSSGWKKPFPDIPATGRNSGVGQVSQKRVKKTLKDAQVAPTADQEEQNRTKSSSKCGQSRQG